MTAIFPRGYQLVCVVLLGSITLCFGRPSDLDFFYKKWRPLELVRGLRSLSVDPFDVFRSLEAVKDLDSDEALDVMHDLDIRPITIYDALNDLSVDPFDAYYALRSWLTDPFLHPPGDHYHRVNATGDPSHPYMHVSYRREQTGKTPKEEYKATYMTSEEVDKALKEIENDYKKSLDSDKLKMSEFINKAKKIHSAFDEPKKLFKDFFGKRHFKEWKGIFPDAFKGLKSIYKNPLGQSLKKGDDVNATTGRDDHYKHLQKGREYFDRKPNNPVSWFGKDITSHDAFKQFNDPNRYETLQDETHVEQEGEPDAQGKAGKAKVHHIKRYYDKKRNMYVECKKTEECEGTDQGRMRKVQSFVRHFDPKSYQNYRQQEQKRQQSQYFHPHQQPYQFAHNSQPYQQAQPQPQPQPEPQPFPEPQPQPEPHPQPQPQPQPLRHPQQQQYQQSYQNPSQQAHQQYHNQQNRAYRQEYHPNNDAPYVY